MAARYFINGGVNSNWSTSGNWSATDGGGASGVKPSAADNVFFTANSPSCTVDTAGVGLTLNFTGYASTITMTAGLTISGSVTLVAAMTIAGAGGLTVTATATLTSNTKTWPNNLTLTNNGTNVLADNWTVGGNLTVGDGGNTTTTVNGAFTLTFLGNFSCPNTNGGTAGAATLIAAGTGTITASSSSGVVKNPFTINSNAGTYPSGYTFATGNFLFSTATLTYTAGVVNAANANLSSSANTTFACNGITWGTIGLSGGGVTHTLNENLNSTGLVSLTPPTNNTFTVNGNTINSNGGFRIAGSGNNGVSGTTILRMNNTGTFDNPSNTSGYISNPITINAGSGRVTISPTLRILLNQLLYTSGNVVTSSSPSVTWWNGPRRVMRLFEGFKIKLISGRLKIQQK